MTVWGMCYCNTDVLHREGVGQYPSKKSVPADVVGLCSTCVWFEATPTALHDMTLCEA